MVDPNEMKIPSSQTARVSYKACANPACMRKVGRGTEWCCRGCAKAQEGGYDPDGYHTSGCNGRAAERGEFNHQEWLWARTSTKRSEEQ